MPLFRFAAPIAALVLLWLGASGSARASEYPPIGVPMELKQISERVYYVQGAAGIAGGFF